MPEARPGRTPETFCTMAPAAATFELLVGLVVVLAVVLNWVFMSLTVIWMSAIRSLASLPTLANALVPSLMVPILFSLVRNAVDLRLQMRTYGRNFRSGFQQLNPNG